MNDYNDGLLPITTLRLDFGYGLNHEAVELGDGTGYIRLDTAEKYLTKRCKNCNWSHIHDCTNYPQDKKYMNKRYCIVWGDGFQGEWVPDDGYCHKWEPRIEKEK